MELSAGLLSLIRSKHGEQWKLTTPYITKNLKGLQQYNSCCSKPLGVTRYVQAMESLRYGEYRKKYAKTKQIYSWAKAPRRKLHCRVKAKTM